MTLTAIHLANAAHLISHAIDAAGTDTEALERIASDCRDLARHLLEYAQFLRLSPPQMPEMAVYEQ